MMRDISVCGEVGQEHVPVASATHPVPWTVPEEAQAGEIVAAVEMWYPLEGNYSEGRVHLVGYMV
jgi:hypothetical protein